MDKPTLMKLESNALTLLHEVRTLLDGPGITSSVCDESIQYLASRIYQLALPVDWAERDEYKIYHGSLD